ncbi:hypothetical protein ABIB40_001552 [Pedobacter sp. UYP30]|uniref:hypothetical protein n=1 Tax=Pedobacter sp. UYP30 TaxID=1756400 RepID=UPI0033959D8A
MDSLTLKKQSDKYDGDISVFNNMLIYKTTLQERLRFLLDAVDISKLQKGIPNQALIWKVIVLTENFKKEILDNEPNLYSLTKSASIVLSELDLPIFDSFNGHLDFYKKFLRYSSMSVPERILVSQGHIIL